MAPGVGWPSVINRRPPGPSVHIIDGVVSRHLRRRRTSSIHHSRIAVDGAGASTVMAFARPEPPPFTAWSHAEEMVLRAYPRAVGEFSNAPCRPVAGWSSHAGGAAPSTDAGVTGRAWTGASRSGPLRTPSPPVKARAPAAWRNGVC